MPKRTPDRSKIKHPTVWIVWETEYTGGYAFEQVRAICTRKWVAEIDAKIVRDQATNHGRRALIQVRPTRLNHLFGWEAIQKLEETHILNPDIGSTEEWERKLKIMEMR